MDPNEVIDFFELLDQCCEALGKPVKSESAKGLFLELLGGYGFANLRGAVLAHMRDPERGRFAPAPADLQAQIEKAMQQDGRPPADEAWSIAVRMNDERATVVSNEEISAAWCIARDIMPDIIGARMAFRSAYERLCAESRACGKQVHWFPSLGLDPRAREWPLKQAAELGRLQSEHIQQFLPAPEPKKEVVALIETTQTGDKAKAAQALASIKKKLKGAAQIETNRA